MGRSGSRGRKQPSLNDLSRAELSLEELSLWKEELSSGSDRACALVGTAYLDHILKAAVESYFRRDLDAKIVDGIFTNAQAPLSSLSGKIEIAFALGHFGLEERTDLHTIRKIRNAFAHSPRPVQFENPLVAKECDALRSYPGITVENVSPRRAKFIVRSLYLNLEIQEKSTSVLQSKVKQLEEAVGRLRSLRQSLNDPNNPLNPNYKVPEAE